ncbi:bifunctional hydroxymethylpyrimidine kinase/phosphomethylpyrimidine kinase, partial [Trichlorobacter lovleyi]|uniref:bifunctional hydroxymethylpyrimidine kinase/phosphomethylpyrimidine kinase n=1 Tax=Trichlorobacter lovleyi TaxID=313985 RepID=UPI0023F2D5D7
MEPLTALTIAGSDSGGGAGIQADLRTFSAFNVHGTTAITAVTAQNTLAVTRVAALDPEDVRAQVDAVLSDFAVAAVKTGMLA